MITYLKNQKNDQNNKEDTSEIYKRQIFETKKFVRETIREVREKEDVNIIYRIKK